MRSMYLLAGLTGADSLVHSTQGSASAPPWANSNVTPLGFKSAPTPAKVTELVTQYTRSGLSVLAVNYSQKPFDLVGRFRLGQNRQGQIV